MTDDELLDVLRQALAQRETEEAEAHDRIEQARAILAAFGGGMPIIIEPKPARHPPQGEPSGARVRDRRCEGCGRMFAAQGFKQHTANFIAEARTPLAVVPNVPAEPKSADELPERRPSTSAQVSGRHFECDDCDLSYLTTRELIHHTISVHNRQPNVTERIPRAAS